MVHERHFLFVVRRFASSSTLAASFLADYIASIERRFTVALLPRLLHLLQMVD